MDAALVYQARERIDSETYNVSFGSSLQDLQSHQYQVVDASSETLANQPVAVQNQRSLQVGALVIILVAICGGALRSKGPRSR